MAFEGMPDFQTSIHDGGVTLLAPFQGEGSYTLLPRGLGIAKREDGAPDFRLGLIRPVNPMLPPKPYGTLDFRVQASFDVEKGLAVLRSRQPGAWLEQARFHDGFLRLIPLGQLEGTNPTLYDSVPVNFQGLGVGRFSTLLDQQAALLVKDLLTSQALALRALAHLESWGVAPRLPLRIHFDPGRFLQYLSAKADQQSRIARSDLVSALIPSMADPPWTVEGDLKQIDPSLFAECMADHVRARFASLVPAARPEGEPTLLLSAAKDFGEGEFDWDLSEPALTSRPIVLTFNLLEEARSLVSSKGLSAVVSTDTVPALHTGVVSLWVVANLPSRRTGILSLGVTVHAPPTSRRPQQINQTVELSEPSDSASMRLQFSAAEKTAFTYRTFVIFQDSAGIHRLEGKDTPAESERLDLHVDDFPVNFVPVEATDRLLAVASVSGTVSHDQVQNRFSLTTAQPRVTLSIPQNAQDASLEFEIRSKDGAHTLKLGPMPPRALDLDLSSFREYGPQSVEVNCTFAGQVQLLGVDLLPEQSTDAPANITTVAMTPQLPKRQWTWFASSPFAPGYRYRLHGTNDWSDVLSPFAPLALQAGAVNRDSEQAPTEASGRAAETASGADATGGRT
jgi:hypothetical protein